ncbi:hypothetical protein [Leuconostoc pseudomesenteroides]|uniref:hypothetical protein n=1 Tax=Leuconostoc pseudomesenteroides TaxID=33968 RepID=UPI0039EC4461
MLIAILFAAIGIGVIGGIAVFVLRVTGKGAVAVANAMVKADYKNQVERVYNTIKDNSEIMNRKFMVEDYSNLNALEIGKMPEDKNENIGKFSKFEISVNDVVKNQQNDFFALFAGYANGLKDRPFEVDQYIEYVQKTFSQFANSNFKSQNQN